MALREAEEIADEPAGDGGVVAAEMQPLPAGLTAAWLPLGAAELVESSGELELRIVVDGAPTLLEAEVRADVDGEIRELAFGPTWVETGHAVSWAVSINEVGIGDELQFDAMISSKIHFERDGHRRTKPLEPFFIHPDADSAFLVFTEDVHESTFAGGDFRGLLPESDGAGPIAHVGVARVVELAPGEELELD